MNKIDIASIKRDIRLSAYFESKTGQTPDKRSRHMFYLCPFHQEKNPSLSITDDNGIYYCFGCGAHGDIYDLVKFYGDEINLRDYCLEASNGKVSAKPSVEPRSREPVPIPSDIITGTTENIWKDPDAKWAQQSLLRRGISAETINRESIGFTWRDNGRITIPVFSVLSQSKSCVDIRCYSSKSRDKIKPYFCGRDVTKYPFIPLSCRQIEKRGMVWIVEGELDAILLSQESDCLVASGTCGAGALPYIWSEKGWRGYINKATTICIATDHDDAGNGARDKLIKESLFGFDGIMGYVVWPDKAPKGYDVTDFLRNHRYEDLCNTVKIISHG